MCACVPHSSLSLYQSFHFPLHSLFLLTLLPPCSAGGGWNKMPASQRSTFPEGGGISDVRSLDLTTGPITSQKETRGPGSGDCGGEDEGRKGPAGDRAGCLNGRAGSADSPRGRKTRPPRTGAAARPAGADESEAWRTRQTDRTSQASCSLNMSLQKSILKDTNMLLDAENVHNLFLAHNHTHKTHTRRLPCGQTVPCRPLHHGGCRDNKLLQDDKLRQSTQDSVPETFTETTAGLHGMEDKGQ
nr:uncharacterized protein LOC105859985 [Microcebus murinus]